MTKLQCRIGVGAYGCLAAVFVAWLAVDAAGKVPVPVQNRSNAPPAVVKSALPKSDEAARQGAVAEVRLPPPPRPSSRLAERVMSAETPSHPPDVPAPIQTARPAAQEAVDPLRELHREPLAPVPRQALGQSKIKTALVVHPVTEFRQAPASEAVAIPPSSAGKTTIRDDGNPATTPAAASVTDGRVTLRLLEHGKGPDIEIAWPDRAGAREKLYAILTRCYGMKLAIMDADNRLFSEESDARGQPWSLNVDRFSGFVRQAEGSMSESERRSFDRISGMHGLRGHVVPVRVFSRRLDAVLIGGLQELSGIPSLARAGTVRATYRIQGNEVLVDRIEIDGASVQGGIRLPPESRGCS